MCARLGTAVEQLQPGSRAVLVFGAVALPSSLLHDTEQISAPVSALYGTCNC